MNAPHAHRSRWLWIVLIVTAGLALAALVRTYTLGTAPAGPYKWLSGSLHDKFWRLAQQQRGFDHGMWEVGYRYQQLAWAAERKDWPYAQYQVEKIQVTLEQAVERRPPRAAATQAFITEAVQPLLEALANNPDDNFAPRFQQFQAACVACHALEKAPIADVALWIRDFSPVPAAAP